MSRHSDEFELWHLRLKVVGEPSKMACSMVVRWLMPLAIGLIFVVNR